MATLGATASTTTFPSGGGAVVGSYKAGYYVSARYSGTGTVVAAVNVLFATPVMIPKACTVDRIGCEVTTVAASSTVRLGIYDQDADGMPGALVLDAGTVDSASGTGDKEITISQALTAGTYWVVAVAQGGTPTMSTLTSGPLGATPTTNTYFSTSTPGYKTGATVSGALPGTYVVSYADQPIRVWLRYV